MRNKKLIKSFKSLKGKVSYFSNGETQTWNIIECEMPMLNDEMEEQYERIEQMKTKPYLQIIREFH